MWNWPWMCSSLLPSLPSSFWEILKPLSWTSTTCWRWLEKALLGECTRVEKNTVLRWWTQKGIFERDSLAPILVENGGKGLYLYQPILWRHQVLTEYDTWIGLLGFNFQLPQFTTLELWAVFLCLSFVIYRMEIITDVVWGLNISKLNHLVQYLIPVNYKYYSFC